MNTHILLVDDDPHLCRLVAARMWERGVQVTWRTSGEAALAALERIEVEAVVTDVRLDSSMYQKHTLRSGGSERRGRRDWPRGRVVNGAPMASSMGKQPLAKRGKEADPDEA